MIKRTTLFLSVLRVWGPTGLHFGACSVLSVQYMLPLGHIFRKFSISFYCYTDDKQIYLPVKREDTCSLTPLLQS